MEKNDIVPIQLIDSKKSTTSASPANPKVAARIKIGQADAYIYNGTDKYILATILKELSFHASRLQSNS
ncbi:hypothetical protein [Enterococcus pallens]|uniref:Uncharacterized protein n=1 Tax=Enterococcus pallens ATCC BAA-351 TaxID=1158607 RepID=R2S0K4_9ENTE|nr:hypothetical protein [Enterococcus pallens]EOH86351.1 hypothetical protein UAU_05273 [Enterococcus pallens ATCC BAA-351]EOU09428.1 hypothetical protein I588_05161 [Enterococcus pallens ATCC BAA-351]OJG77575.1 hypothetical protein RV10_GL002409 [Enterococcus pallens]